MYQWEIPRLPKIISRYDFVQLVFELGAQHQHNYDNIITAVEIGDIFVSYTGQRTPYIFLAKKYHIRNDPDYKRIMEESVPQVYSEELAHVVTIIMGKAMEDNGYRWTVDAVQEFDNYYIFKMEFEVCMILEFQIRVRNIMSLFGSLLWLNPHDSEISFGSAFWDLSLEICLNKDLLSANPITILIGSILLYKRGKLRAIRVSHQRIFTTLINRLAKEYEVKLPDLLRAYIQVKTSPPVEIDKDLLIQESSEELSKQESLKDILDRELSKLSITDETEMSLLSSQDSSKNPDKRDCGLISWIRSSICK